MLQYLSFLVLPLCFQLSLHTTSFQGELCWLSKKTTRRSDPQDARSNGHYTFTTEKLSMESRQGNSQESQIRMRCRKHYTVNYFSSTLWNVTNNDKYSNCHRTSRETQSYLKNRIQDHTCRSRIGRHRETVTTARV